MEGREEGTARGTRTGSIAGEGSLKGYISGRERAADGSKGEITNIGSNYRSN
jgi:hypothetical protein